MLIGVVFFAVAASSPLDSGSDAPTQDPQPAEEIVVTGERVARSVSETPSSVAVVGAKEIERASGADRIDQILDLIPNVQVSSGGEGPTIRGQDTTGPTRDLPAFLGGTRPRTTLIVDGRPVSFNEFVFGAAPLWDVDRVEVFRSPQTTTQGQNSIAGAIFVETSDPSFTRQFRARGIAGDFRTRQVSVSATGPLSGEVAVRLAGDLRYSRTASKIDDRAEGADPNHDVYGLLRLKLLARPGAIPGSRFELSYTHSQSQMPQVEGLRQPFKRRRDPLDGYGTFGNNTDSLTGSVALELSPGLFVNTTLTAGDGHIRRFAPEGLGETEIHTRDWSAESVGRWSPDGPISATIGASYRHAALRQVIDLSQLSGIGRFRDKQDAFGLFGEVNWSLTPKLHLTAGLRYQRDSQTRSGALAAAASPIDLDYDRTFDAWLPKLSLAYDVADALRVGLLVQRAYNPGGTTLRFDTGAPDLFEAESLWDYELFARASLAGGKITASANLFHYDIKDAQRGRAIVILAPTGSPVTFADLFNVPAARSRGAEASIMWRPNSELSAKLAIGLLRTKITRSEAPYTQYDGKEFQRSPRLSLSAAVDWTLLDHLALSAQLRHNSGYFSDDLNQGNRKIDGWTKIDVRAAYDFKRFRAFGYVRNLLDDFYLTYLFTPTFATAGDPREFGVGLETRF